MPRSLTITSAAFIEQKRRMPSGVTVPSWDFLICDRAWYRGFELLGVGDQVQRAYPSHGQLKTALLCPPTVNGLRGGQRPFRRR